MPVYSHNFVTLQGKSKVNNEGHNRDLELRGCLQRLSSGKRMLASRLEEWVTQVGREVGGGLFRQNLQLAKALW